MWIEDHGRVHRVVWRAADKTKQRLAFDSREMAELFIELSRRTSLSGAVAYVNNPSDALLRSLLSAETQQPLPATAGTGSTWQLTQGSAARTAPQHQRSPVAALSSGSEMSLVGLTFRQLWQRFLDAQRGLEETTLELYESYGELHLLPFFGDSDLAQILRCRPLRVRDEVHGAVYVDDWIGVMLAKPRLNNARRPIEGTRLTVKYIKNVRTVLIQCLDMALTARPSLLDVNPAKDTVLPKTDVREMHFLPDGTAFSALRGQMHEHFRPLLDFLIGTGARFGEAAGLLVRHVHLDVERPYVEIRLILKWSRKKWRLGRPKTRSSVRRITLSPRLTEMLRALIADKSVDDHVFTMIEGGPLHHGNFSARYFKPAVAAAAKQQRYVPRALRIHDLRHTHAAWLISDGVDIALVARRLGHSTSTTTRDIYAHITPEADDRSLASIDRRLPDLVTVPSTADRLASISRGEQAQYPEFDVDDTDDLAA